MAIAGGAADVKPVSAVPVVAVAGGAHHGAHIPNSNVIGLRQVSFAFAGWGCEVERLDGLAILPVGDVLFVGVAHVARNQRPAPAMLTIQLTPNLSRHMPKVSPQICLSSGMTILPPALSLSQ